MLGLGTTAHLVPFHRWIRVRKFPLYPSYPTAQALVAAPAATCTSVLSPYRAPLGLGTMLQPVLARAANAAEASGPGATAAPPSTQPARPSGTPAQRAKRAATRPARRGHRAAPQRSPIRPPLRPWTPVADACGMSGSPFCLACFTGPGPPRRVLRRRGRPPASPLLPGERKP